MGTIVHRQGRPRPWLAQIKRKGHPVYSKAFHFEADAKRWVREEERSLDITGLPATVKDYQNVPVSKLVIEYLKKVSPTKASYVNEKIMLTNFLKRDIAKKSIVYVSHKDAAEYRDIRLSELTRYGTPTLPSSV